SRARVSAVVVSFFGSVEAAAAAAAARVSLASSAASARAGSPPSPAPQAARMKILKTRVMFFIAALRAGTEGSSYQHPVSGLAGPPGTSGSEFGKSGESHEGQGHQAGGDQTDGRAAEAFRHVGHGDTLARGGEHDQHQAETQRGAE